MTEFVTYVKREGVAVLTIDNPPLNVLSKHIQTGLEEAIDELSRDDEVVCIILTTAGSRAFIAGADIKEFPSMVGNENMLHDVMGMHRLLNKIEQMPKPTIAVLDGLTFGGGCELALAFDIRIAEEQATIAFPEVKLGIFPGGGGTQRLPRLVGTSKAKEMMYTGVAISAEAAERIGLVSSVVAEGLGLQAATELGKQIANHSLQALSRIKEAVDQGMELEQIEAIELEAKLFTEVFQTEDMKEGIDAFINKREPVFKHR